MDLNWLQSLLFGLLSGLMDILPVSAQAHRVMMLKLFGAEVRSDLFFLMMHLGVFAALYFSCTAHLVRMGRASRLSRIPKRKRKRPLDVKSLMDLSMLKTMLVPVLLAVVLHQFTEKFQNNLLAIAFFLLLNGVILYAPLLLPTGNRDSRTLSRVEGLLMGLGSGLSILPGISGVGCVCAIGSVCGVERRYCLDMALLVNMFLNLGYAFLNVLAIAGGGAGTLTIGLLLRYLAAGVAAFAGTLLGVRLMRRLAENQGYGLFAFYSFSFSLFAFILNLLA